MAEKACVKCLQKEFRDLCKITFWREVKGHHLQVSSSCVCSLGICKNFLEHYAKIKFPPEYPFKPPGISMITPNGWFMTQENLPIYERLILNGLLSFMMDNIPTAGSVSTTIVEKQRLAKASLAFNCKNPTFKKVFPEYLDKYEEQLAAKQHKLEQDTSAPTQEGLLNPLLEKQGAKAELKKIEAPKELNNRRKRSFPVWWLLLVSTFVVVMALPPLQL